jgi:hypothetical protein
MQISSNVLLASRLLCAEDSHALSIELNYQSQLTASEIIGLDLPARNRVEALLRREFLSECHLQMLACDFAEHTLHVFESYRPDDRRPRKLVETARSYYSGNADKGQLKSAFIETWKAIERFTEAKYTSAFASGLAASLLYSDEAGKMARDVALWSQNAAHRKEWENRRSHFEPMVAREKESLWQLARIAKRLVLYRSHKTNSGSS